MMRILEIVEECIAACTPVCAVQLRDEVNVSRKDVPRRMVWFLDEALSRGGRPRGERDALVTDTWSLVVHCWGDSAEQALRLRQAAITAVHRTVERDDESYRVVRTTMKGGDDRASNGRVAVLAFEINVPLHAADLNGPEFSDAQSQYVQAEHALVRGVD